MGMLFGLTTAFLFSVLEAHWPSHALDGGFSTASTAPALSS